MEEVRIWETFNCKDIEEIIKGNLRTIDEKFAQITAGFVTNGYYLRRQHDEKMYEAEGYGSFEEYVKTVYGKSRSWAKRMMQINEKFSIGGNDPRIDKKYVEYSVSQLQEMLYLEEDQLENITPDMTIKEIREVRKPEIQEEPVSILGYPIRVYPEDSLIATPGCGKVDCFSCHRDGCELRQVDCYCVEAPMGNPFPCTTLSVVENLRQDVGNCCQFVNEDLAFHRAGDGQPVPCCKQCQNPCGYECRRSVQAKHEAEEAKKKKPCDVAQDEQEQIPGQMNVEDYPELLPEKKEPNIDIDNGIDNDEDNLVYEQPEVVMDAEYQEVIEERPKIPDTMLTYLVEACIEELDFDAGFEKTEDTEEFHDWVYDELFEMSIRFRFNGTELRADFYGEISIYYAETEFELCTNYTWNQFFEELERIGDIGERCAAENAEIEEIRCQEAANLDALTFSQIAIRDYLEEEERTLSEYEKVNSEDDGLPHNLMMRQRMLVKALMLLKEHEMDVADQDNADEPEEQEELEQVQPELPVLKNNDQRKEWLNNYKEWGLWYRDEHIDVDYYKYDFSDGSRLVVAEYPQRRMYWKANEFKDEHYYHLLDKNRKFYGSNKTFEQQYVHSADSETSLVEFLKNIQKGEKK